MQAISTLADLEEARSLPRAVVFLWVNWAAPARNAETIVNELEVAWGKDHADCPVGFFRADLSEQKGEVWEAVRDWLRSEGQPVDSLTFGGGGALVWLRSGSVVATVGNAARVEGGKLLAATYRILKCSTCGR